MSFSSRRRNYMLQPHRRDGLIEWMKHMLQHSFVLDALDQTAPETFRHFEELIEEHREWTRLVNESTLSSTTAAFQTKGVNSRLSKLRQLVPTVGVFHTNLPLRRAFKAYDDKYKVTARRHVTVSFNEIRQILNLAQVMALCGAGASSSSSSAGGSPPPPPPPLLPAAFAGPSIVTFDGDQTLYTDGANFEKNPRLALSISLLLEAGVAIAVVTAAGYEYDVDKYTLRINGLLSFFRERKELTPEMAGNFYMFGGECNYLLRLNGEYELEPVQEKVRTTTRRHH